MSTKTTFKRIALATVAALGFGVLSSVAPASAAPQSMTVGYTSLTVVGNGYGLIPVNVIDTVTGLPSTISNTESLTATVTAWPTGVDSTTAAADLAFTVETRTTASGYNTFAVATNSGFSRSTSPTDSLGGAWIGNDSYGAGVSTTNLLADYKGTYWFAVKPASSGKALDKGTYTIRFRLTDSTGFITSVSIPVNFVTSPADSGAAITVSTAGSFTSGETTTMTATKSVTAALTNGVAGGRVQLATADGLTLGIPALNAATWAGTTAAVVDATTKWWVTDTGTAVTGGTVAGDFYSATGAADTATAWTKTADGVYGIQSATGSGWSGLALTHLSVSPYFRVTYGATAATKAITVTNAISGTATTPVFTGVGALTAVEPFKLPLSTKTFSFRVGGATAGNAYSYSVAYTYVGAGDQTPLAATPTTVYADSAGFITVPVTNANPVDGATAAVTITGFATNPGVQNVSWAKSKATNISVDMGGATVALKSTNVFTATITDAFGAPVSGVLLQPALSATGSNGSATLVLPTVTTNAAGQATYSLTDALAVAAGTDTVSFSAVDGTTLAGTASATIMYAATAPAPTTLTAYYSATPATSTNDDAIRVAPAATGVYRSGTTAFSIQKSRNNSVATTVVDSADQLRIVISAGVAGAKVTATASTGAYVLNSASFQASSASKYTGTTGYAASFVVGSNKTGANTVTFTSGTATTTVAFWVENTGTDARFVKLAQAATAGPVVATVTDRYGNGVSGAQVQISTSAGTLGNGQMTTVYTTDLDGKVSVLPVGADSAVITAIATKTDAEHAALAGYTAAGLAIDSTVAAGNSTATLAVAPAASASDVAQTATDAAAEATDAANAATDAANAAAEAADAATAAAQDAADAVAALSTQVSEMVNALKKQITALTNLVIKIQKKVKA